MKYLLIYLVSKGYLNPILIKNVAVVAENIGLHGLLSWDHYLLPVAPDTLNVGHEMVTDYCSKSVAPFVAPFCLKCAKIQSSSCEFVYLLNCRIRNEMVYKHELWRTLKNLLR
jgi:hypothetical protein